MSTIRSGAPGVRGRPNPLRAAEHAYLEALITYGFDSPECAAAFVALRRARQADCAAAGGRERSSRERAA